MWNFEARLADVALLVIAIVVCWDLLVWTGQVKGITITDEIRHSWRAWPFFFLAGTIAGGHFLSNK